MNDISRQTLENEIQVYKRLGSHDGIIESFQSSSYGVELARAQGDLEDYIKDHPEPANTSKVAWILSLIKAFSHIHSWRVFVDDIALHNILVLDGQLKVADFGQAIVLPLGADITTITENYLNIRIEILHLGWILYSVASWKAHRYYFFDSDEPKPSWPVSFPKVDDVLCGKFIEKCWRGEYASTDDLKIDALELLAGQIPRAVAEKE
jgi:serine/threonine protein kinase